MESDEDMEGAPLCAYGQWAPPSTAAPKSEDVLRSSVLTEDIPSAEQASWPSRHADQVEAVTALLQLEDADELPRRQAPTQKMVKVSNPRQTAGPPLIAIKPPVDIAPALENVNAPDMKNDIGRIVRVIDGAHKGKKGVFKGAGGNGYTLVSFHGQEVKVRQSKLVIVDESAKSKASRKGKPGPSTPQPLRSLFGGSPTTDQKGSAAALAPPGKSESPDSVLSPHVVGSKRARKEGTILDEKAPNPRSDVGKSVTIVGGPHSLQIGLFQGPIGNGYYGVQELASLQFVKVRLQQLVLTPLGAPSLLNSTPTAHHIKKASGQHSPGQDDDFLVRQFVNNGVFAASPRATSEHAGIGDELLSTMTVNVGGRAFKCDPGLLSDHIELFANMVSVTNIEQKDAKAGACLGAADTAASIKVGAMGGGRAPAAGNILLGAASSGAVAASTTHSLSKRASLLSSMMASLPVSEMDFEAICSFIQDGTCAAQPESIVSLIRAAHCLGMNMDFIDQAETYLCDILCPPLFAVYKLLADQLNLPRLQDRCFALACAHFDEVNAVQGFVDVDETFLLRLMENDGVDADERDLYNMLQQWRKHYPAPTDGSVGCGGSARRPSSANPARQLAFHRLVLKLRLPLLPPTLLAAEVEQVVREAYLNVTSTLESVTAAGQAENEGAGGCGRLLRASSVGSHKVGGSSGPAEAKIVDVNAMFLDVYRWHCAGGAEQQGIKLPCMKRRRATFVSGRD